MRLICLWRLKGVVLTLFLKTACLELVYLEPINSNLGTLKALHTYSQASSSCWLDMRTADWSIIHQRYHQYFQQKP